jgi:hypothetical protein
MKLFITYLSPCTCYFIRIYNSKLILFPVMMYVFNTFSKDTNLVG